MNAIRALLSGELIMQSATEWPALRVEVETLLADFLAAREIAVNLTMMREGCDAATALAKVNSAIRGLYALTASDVAGPPLIACYGDVTITDAGIHRTGCPTPAQCGAARQCLQAT